jgi:hypothetical protein
MGFFFEVLTLMTGFNISFVSGVHTPSVEFGVNIFYSNMIFSVLSIIDGDIERKS